MLKPSAAFLVSMIATAGCANLNSIHHEFSDSSHTGGAKVRAVSVGAEQRFLEFAYNESTSGTYPTKLWQICAEPSPDALAAFSGSFAGSLSGQAAQGGGGAVNLATALAAQAAAFGLRTQSITLLRDNAFRLCEGHLNRSLDSRQFETLHRRLQNIMVASLAIEQLTGYARPTIATVGANASANAGGGVLEAQRVLDQAENELTSKETAAQAADKAVETAKTEVTTTNETATMDKKNAEALSTKAATDATALKTARDAATKVNADPKATPEAKKAANDAVTKAEEVATQSAKAAKDATDKADKSTAAKKAADEKLVTVTDNAKKAKDAVIEAKKNVQALTAARDQARSTTASAFTMPGQISGPPPSPQATTAVAAAVTEIVKKVVDRDYSADICLWPPGRKPTPRSRSAT